MDPAPPLSWFRPPCGHIMAKSTTNGYNYAWPTCSTVMAPNQLTERRKLATTVFKTGQVLKTIIYLLVCITKKATDMNMAQYWLIFFVWPFCFAQYLPQWQENEVTGAGAPRHWLRTAQVNCSGKWERLNYNHIKYAHLPPKHFKHHKNGGF